MLKLKPLKLKIYDSKRATVFFVFVVLSLLVLWVGSVFVGQLVGKVVLFNLSQNLIISYSLGVLWAMILWVSILFWPIQSRDREALFVIWMIKIIVVLVLMRAYEQGYGFDADGYFENAITDNFHWDGFKFGNGTRIIAQLVWLHNKIMFSSYYAANIGFALIGLIGVYLFYRAATLFLQKQDIRILYVLAFFPSILFWSSILGKDPITFFGISLYAYGIVAWHRLRQQRYLIALFVGIFIVALIRMWLVPIVLLPLLFLVIIVRRSLAQRIVFIAVCISLFAIVLSKIKIMWGVSTVDDLFKFRSYATTAFVGGGSSFKSPEITGFIDLIKYLPFGIFTALFRPLPWDVPNIFGFIQGLDNVVLLILLIISIKRTQWKELKDPVLLWAIFLILTWALFYGMVTYNLGTLARYKLQILPVILGLLLYFSRRRVKMVL